MIFLLLTSKKGSLWVMAAFGMDGLGGCREKKFNGHLTTNITAKIVKMFQNLLTLRRKTIKIAY